MTPGRTPADFRQVTGGIKLRAEDPNYVPRLGDAYATFAIAITSYILAYAGQYSFSAILILIYLGLWLPFARFRHSLTLKVTTDSIIVMLVPCMALLSVIWSPAPNISAYSALEYTASLLCAIIIGRLVRTLAYLRGFNISVAVILILSILSGNYGVDPFSGNYSLVGLFGSKNQVGLFGELGIFLSFIGVLYPQKTISKILYFLPSFIVSALALYLSKSASSELSLILTFLMLILVYLITRIHQKYRIFACCIIFTLTTAVVALGTIFNWQNTILYLFGKDATLTGRTLLWQKGLESASDMPILGHGYAAFWIPGNPVAEEMWYTFAINGRFGFHFHNLFIESLVEMGVIGLCLICLLLIYTLLKSLGGILRFGMIPEYMLAFGISIMFLIRAFVEVDLIGTFGIPSVVYFTILPRLATYKKEKKGEKAA